MSRRGDPHAGRLGRAGAARGEVVVVGGGIFGMLTAWRLQRAGHRVVLICERHLDGATAASAAVVRTTCDEPVLAAESLRWYQDWSRSRSARAALFLPSGVAIVAAPEVGPAVRAAALRAESACRGAGAALGRPADLVPGYRLDGEDIWFEPASGYADPRMMVRSVLFAFLAAGGRIRWATVRSVHRRRRTWLLRTSGADLVAPTVLLAAGAATASLLPEPGSVPSVTRAPAYVGLFRLPSGAVTTVLIDLSRGLLLRPHPDGVLGSVRECGAGAFLPTLRRLASARLPGLLSAEPELVARSEFDVTPDGKPLIGAVDEGLYVAYGFSGSGFKLAPALCRAIGDLVGTGAVPASLAAYDPLRACGVGTASPLLG